MRNRVICATESFVQLSITFFQVDQSLQFWFHFVDLNKCNKMKPKSESLIHIEESYGELHKQSSCENDPVAQIKWRKIAYRLIRIIFCNFASSFFLFSFLQELDQMTRKRLNHTNSSKTSTGRVFSRDRFERFFAVRKKMIFFTLKNFDFYTQMLFFFFFWSFFFDRHKRMFRK